MRDNQFACHIQAQAQAACSVEVLAFVLLQPHHGLEHRY